MCSAFLDLSQQDKWTDSKGKLTSMFLQIGFFVAISIESTSNPSLHPLVHSSATAEQSPYPALGFEKVPYSLFQLASFKYGRSSVELDFSDLMHVLYIQLSNRCPPFIPSHMLWEAHRGIVFKANVA
jgi:hypothetical protein